MTFNKNAYDILTDRGFVMLTNDETAARKMLSENPVTFYLGIDPTADDLHIGHFFALQMFRILQDCGHRGVLLLGGATAMVGDPSFKNNMRSMLTKDQVDRNAREINGILHRFIALDGANPAIVVNNADWIRPRGYIDFMREVGVHFNVAKMLAADAYKNRIKEGGLTFLEMGYMLMQAYDFVHLNDTHGCTLQIGGSDQWGNILAGAELGRKMSFADGRARPTMVGICCPLLTKSDGTKMGKTEKGVLWVNRDKSSVFDCYQHFVNVYDEDVERLLRFFTMIPVTEIKKMCATDIVAAKKRMAYEVTKKIHGTDAAEEAKATAEQLFSGEGHANSENAPTEAITLPRGSLVVDALALTSIIKSKREARELIAAGAITIDHEKITDPAATLDPAKGEFLIKKGKKTFLKIVMA
jgi:tyrosyl-tRNA synthetase